MAAVFRTNILGRIEDRGEPTIWTSSGTVIDVDGKPFVRMEHGSTLVELDDSWSTTVAQAKRRVAQQLDAAAARLAAQATAIRAQAEG